MKKIIYLIQLSHKYQKPDGNWYARYICKCGDLIILKVKDVDDRKIKSCGCHKRYDEYVMQIKIMHRIWRGMLNRCYNCNNSSYKYYGERGIKVCDRWIIFYNFVMDMGLRPSNNLSIDRIDNNGNYERLNCRWATKSVQNSNKSDSTKYKMTEINLELLNIIEQVTEHVERKQRIKNNCHNGSLVRASEPLSLMTKGLGYR